MALKYDMKKDEKKEKKVLTVKERYATIKTESRERKPEQTARKGNEMKTESIKFFWNGIKVNGGKLIRTWYSIDNINDPQAVSISARDYDHLPGDVFSVSNDSDIYTDYFDSDHATIEAGHPLYIPALVAALKCELRMVESNIRCAQKRIARGSSYWEKSIDEYTQKAARYRSMLQSLPDKQPTAEDLAAVAALRLEEETARKAEEHERELQEREKELNERAEARRIVRETAERYPLDDAAAVRVVIKWSESDAFVGENLIFSVPAAEIILRTLDERRAGGLGYDKTSFVVEYPEGRYEGRYDLGDGEGGLIEHIRKFGETCKLEEDRNRIAALVDILRAQMPQDAASEAEETADDEEPAEAPAQEKRSTFADPVLFLRSIETENQRFDLFAVPRGNGVTYSYTVNEYFPSLHKWRYLCQENNLSGDALLFQFGFNSFADLMQA